MITLKTYVLALLLVIACHGLRYEAVGQPWKGTNNVEDDLFRKGRIGVGTNLPEAQVDIWDKEAGYDDALLHVRAGDEASSSIAGLYASKMKVTKRRVYIGSVSEEADAFVPADFDLAVSRGASIGTLSIDQHVTGGYKLLVGGKVLAEELKINEIEDWPDYVFDESHTLPSLREVETFVTQKKHLPGMPSAAHVSEEGVLVGDMQKRLLEKIEELTLYLIEQDKQIARLNQEIDALKQR